MTQLGLEYGLSHRVLETRRRLLEATREMVSSIGLKQAAGEIDVAPSALADALAERERKGVRLSWMPSLLAVAHDSHRQTFCGEFNAFCGYEMTRKRALTDAELVARTRHVLVAKLGQLGAQLLEEIER